MFDPFISTFTGRRFYLNRPTPDMVSITDVAHALSQLCRFTGHCNRFYSVAEHSVLVSHIVPPELALVGLLHDATEAYIGDIAKPLKNLLPDYQRIEEQVWLAVAESFGIPPWMPPEVKAADLALLKREVNVFLPPHCLDELNLPGPMAGCVPTGLASPQAEMLFLTRFTELVQLWGLPGSPR